MRTSGHADLHFTGFPGDLCASARRKRPTPRSKPLLTPWEKVLEGRMGLRVSEGLAAIGSTSLFEGATAWAGRAAWRAGVGKMRTSPAAIASRWPGACRDFIDFSLPLH